MSKITYLVQDKTSLRFISTQTPIYFRIANELGILKVKIF